MTKKRKQPDQDSIIHQDSRITIATAYSSSKATIGRVIVFSNKTGEIITETTAAARKQQQNIR